MTGRRCGSSRARRAIILTIAVLLLAPGPATAGTEKERRPLTHRELVDRAFTICARASNRIRAIRPAFTLRRSATTTAAVIGHLRRVVDRLGSLEPPAADQQRLGSYLTLLSREIGALARGRDAARRGDRDGFSAAYRDAAGISLKARSIADRLGLEVCGTL